MNISIKGLLVLFAFCLRLNAATDSALGPRLDRMEKRFAEIERQIEIERKETEAREGVRRSILFFEQRYR